MSKSKTTELKILNLRVTDKLGKGERIVLLFFLLLVILLIKGLAFP